MDTAGPDMTRDAPPLVLADLPIEILVPIARFLPTPSILTFSQTSRAFRRILAHRALWTHLDFSTLGATFTDSSWFKFVLLAATRWPFMSGTADEAILDEAYPSFKRIVREVVLDGTAVTGFTAIRVLGYPSVRKVSFRDCPALSLYEVVEFLQGTFSRPREVPSPEDGRYPVSTVLTSVDFGGADACGSVNDIGAFNRAARSVYPQLRYMRPEICPTCMSGICSDESYVVLPRDREAPFPQCEQCIVASSCDTCHAYYSVMALADYEDADQYPITELFCEAGEAGCEQETRFCKECATSWFRCGAGGCPSGFCPPCMSRVGEDADFLRCKGCEAVGCLDHLRRCGTCKAFYACWKCEESGETDGGERSVRCDVGPRYANVQSHSFFLPHFLVLSGISGGSSYFDDRPILRLVPTKRVLGLDLHPAKRVLNTGHWPSAASSFVRVQVRN